MASTPRLVKISRPQVGQTYPRNRLYQRLDTACERPVVWISGPAGSGKTTLVSSYIEARRPNQLWYQVDEGDADVASFFYYMSLAAKQAAGNNRLRLPLLSRDFNAGLPVFAKNYFRELFRRLPAPSVVVLDNAQDAPADGDFGTILRQGLAEVPPGIVVIVISRGQLPPSLYGLKARGLVASLSWDDLRLTPEESTGICHLRCGGARLSHQLLDAVYQHTRGWIAGLLLALERLENQAEPMLPALVDSTSREATFDFFAGEIFERQSEGIQRFLLLSADLPQLTAATAERLTGQADSGEILKRLVADNHFTVRLDGLEQTFAYHPLFRDFLRQRAAAAFPREDLREHKRRAAQLLLDHGDVEDAASLFAAIGEHAGLIALIHRHATTLLEQGRRQTLRSWLDTLPTAAVEDDPWLLYWKGGSLYPYQLTESRAAFEQSYWKFKAGDDYEGACLAAGAVANTYFHAFSAFHPLKDWLTELKALFERRPAQGSRQVEARVILGLLPSLCWHDPYNPEIGFWVGQAEALLREDLGADLRMMLGHGLFIYYIRWRGDLAATAAVVDQLRPIGRRADLAPLSRLMWKTIQATFGWVTHNVDDGIRAAREGLKISERTGVHVFDMMLGGLMVYGELSRGDLPAAGEQLARIQPRLREDAIVEHALYHYLAAWAALGQGDLPAGRDHARLAVHHSTAAGDFITTAYGLTTLAQALIESGETREGLRTLARVHRQGRRLGNGYLEMSCLTIRAYHYLLLRGDLERGLRALRAALALGRSQGYLTWPGTGWRRDILAQLCVIALDHEIEVDYVHGLIRARQLTPATPPSHLQNWPWPVRIRVLGRPQVEVAGKPCPLAGKPLELLLALAFGGERAIGEEDLIAGLWPEAEPRAGHHSLETTLYRLRKQLGGGRTVELSRSRLRLHPESCWVDAWAIGALLKRLEEALSREAEPAVLVHLQRGLRRILDDADLAHGDPDYPPLAYLRRRVARALESLGLHWQQRADWRAALECFELGVQLDPLEESGYRRLMACHGAAGQASEVLAVFQRCESALRTGLDVAPETQTRDLLQALGGAGRRAGG